MNIVSGDGGIRRCAIKSVDLTVWIFFQYIDFKLKIAIAANTHTLYLREKNVNTSQIDHFPAILKLKNDDFGAF